MRMRTPLLLLLVIPGLANAATLTVGSGKTYSTISGAISAATAGDTIEVDAGTYNEVLAISIDLIITGAGSGTTTITKSGGATGNNVAITGGTVSITGFTFGSNRRAISITGGADLTVDDIVIDGPGTKAEGSGIHCLGTVGTPSALTVTGSTFSNMSATDFGGALYGEFCGITISGSTFDTNDADYGGHVLVIDADLSVSTSTMDDGVAGENGGGIYVEDGDASITFTDFDTGSAKYGGHVMVVDGDLTITDGTLTAGAATTEGGAVNHWATTSTSTYVLTLDTVTFTSNSSTGTAGAVMADYSYTVDIDDCSFSTNTATTAGGGLFFNHADGRTATAILTIDGTTFSSNTAGTDGGAAYIERAKSTIDDVSFTSDSAVGDQGGALYFHDAEDDISISNSTFSSHDAQDGAGIYIDGDDADTTSVTFSGLTFSDCDATQHGGAVYIAQIDTIDIDDGWFEDCDATTDGGALYVDDSGGVGVDLSYFCTNTAGGNGGAILAQTLDNAFTIDNTVLVENDADKGGGVYITSGDTFDLTNNTILGNYATDTSGGGGVYIESTDPDLVNTLFAHNTSGYGIYGSSVTTATHSYGAWYNNSSADFGGSSTITAWTATVTTDPDLSYWTDDGACSAYELWPNSGSPLIDAGDTTILDPDGSTSDIGAYGGPITLNDDLFDDVDGDGEIAMTDCDDNDGDNFHGNTEICDNQDNDCDGDVDDDDADLDTSTGTTYYADTDGDGEGDSATTVAACDQPTGYVTNSLDCDDDDEDNYTTNTEICDGSDNDCDNDVDDDDADVDLSTGTTYYADTDGDGYGDIASTDIACDAPSGYVANSGDCDDGAAGVNPGATEICDSIDNDCDSDIDDDDSTLDTSTQTTYYADTDGDGEGDSASTYDACTEPSGYVSNSLDCDDDDEDNYTTNTEICDGQDNDCDNDVDDDDADVDTSTGSTYYADTDGDGFGDASVSEMSCDAQTGYVANDLDCDDAVTTINPDGSEVCDSVDNDCDGFVDDDDPSLDLATQTTYYLDTDGDGHGGTVEVRACSLPSDATVDSTDCDDTDLDTYPGATEQCDGVDNDCDEEVDEDVEYIDYYADTDGDGYGDASGTPLNDCARPDGYVSDNTDCDDAESEAYPGNTEVWYDGIDGDCDGWDDYDQDRDGHSSIDHEGDDCDDENADVHPGAVEIAGNNIDEDCDGIDGSTDDGSRPFNPSDGEEPVLVGCGCSTTPAPMAAWPMLLGALGLVGMRRRRSHS